MDINAILEEVKDLMADSKYREARDKAMEGLNIDSNNQELNTLFNQAKELWEMLAGTVEQAENMEKEGRFLSAHRKWMQALELSPFSQDIQKKADQMAKMANREMRDLYLKVLDHQNKKMHKKAYDECLKVLDAFPNKVKFQKLFEISKKVVDEEEKLLAKAKKELEERNWKGVLKNCQVCLELDPHREEARNLYQSAHNIARKKGEDVKGFVPLPHLLNIIGAGQQGPDSDRATEYIGPNANPQSVTESDETEFIQIPDAGIPLEDQPTEFIQQPPNMPDIPMEEQQTEFLRPDEKKPGR